MSFSYSSPRKVAGFVLSAIATMGSLSAKPAHGFSISPVRSPLSLLPWRALYTCVYKPPLLAFFLSPADGLSLSLSTIAIMVTKGSPPNTSTLRDFFFFWPIILYVLPNLHSQLIQIRGLQCIDKLTHLCAALHLYTLRLPQLGECAVISVYTIHLNTRVCATGSMASFSPSLSLFKQPTTFLCVLKHHSLSQHPRPAISLPLD